MGKSTSSSTLHFGTFNTEENNKDWKTGPRIGRGGCGTVYAVHSILSNANVAGKRFSEAYGPAELAASLKETVLLLKHLSDLHVVQVLGL